MVNSVCQRYDRRESTVVDRVNSEKKPCRRETDNWSHRTLFSLSSPETNGVRTDYASWYFHRYDDRFILLMFSLSCSMHVANHQLANNCRYWTFFSFSSRRRGKTANSMCIFGWRRTLIWRRRCHTHQLIRLIHSRWQTCHSLSLWFLWRQNKNKHLD